MVANSILKARGFDNVINVEGGMGAIRKTNVPVVADQPVAH
jgi:rhodanese-related sulfurtransferase